MLINISFSLQYEIDNYLNSLWKFKWEKHGRQNYQEKLLKPFPVWFKNKLKQAKTKSEAGKVIGGFIQENILTKAKKYKDLSANLEKTWKLKQIETLSKLESVYGNPVPFNKLTVYLTSIPICPYSFKEGWIMVFANAPIDEQISTIRHELNHFMFYYYFPQMKKSLGINKYESLKEALTVFTNPEEVGYPAQRKLRTWLKSQKGTVGEILKNQEFLNLL